MKHWKYNTTFFHKVHLDNLELALAVRHLVESLRTLQFCEKPSGFVFAVIILDKNWNMRKKKRQPNRPWPFWHFCNLLEKNETQILPFKTSRLIQISTWVSIKSFVLCLISNSHVPPVLLSLYFQLVMMDRKMLNTRTAF